LAVALTLRSLPSLTSTTLLPLWLRLLGLELPLELLLPLNLLLPLVLLGLPLHLLLPESLILLTLDLLTLVALWLFRLRRPLAALILSRAALLLL
jgi:hypothetical protein